MLIVGTALALMATFNLGRNLMPLPRDDGRLAEGGTYRLVRHPIYNGITLASFGWALWCHGWLTLTYAIDIFIFFDIESRREERWLMQRYAAYGEYHRRVRKLIPFPY